MQFLDLEKKYETSVTEIFLVYNNMATKRNTYLASSFFVITNDAFEMVEQNTIKRTIHTIFHE